MNRPRRAAGPPLSPPPNPDAWVRTHRATYERMAVDYARRIDDYAAADEAERFTRLAAPSDVEPARASWTPAVARAATPPCCGWPAPKSSASIWPEPCCMRPGGSTTEGSLCQGDLRRLPFATNSFDAVWCFAALGHLPPAAISNALTEFRRILDGGWLYVVVRQGSGVRTASWHGAHCPATSPTSQPDSLTAALNTRRLHHPRTEHLARPPTKPPGSTPSPRAWLRPLNCVQ